MTLWEGAAGVIIGGCIPLAWSWWRRRVERRGEITGVHAEFFRIHLQLRALFDAKVEAPLYRLPISVTSQVLPKLIGDGVLDENDVYVLIEWVNRIEELNRGLDRAGDAHASNDAAGARNEYSRNLAKAREIIEESLERFHGQTLLDAAESIFFRLEEGGSMRRLIRFVKSHLKAIIWVALGVLILVAATMAIVFLRYDWGHNPDSRTFWRCGVATALAIALVLYLARKDRGVRIAGMFFQTAGIVVTILNIQDVRTKLDQPGMIAALATYIENPLKGESPHPPEGAHLQASAGAQSEITATLTTHRTSLPTEDRLTELEDQMANLESTHAKDIGAINRIIRASQASESDSHQQLAESVRGVRGLIAELQTGGLPLTLFGLVWIIIGTFLASIPDVIAPRIERLHQFCAAATKTQPRQPSA